VTVLRIEINADTAIAHVRSVSAGDQRYRLEIRRHQWTVVSVVPSPNAYQTVPVADGRSRAEISEAGVVPLTECALLERLELVGPIEATAFTHSATVSAGAGPTPVS